MLKRISAVLSLLLLCGCFDVTDELTLNADGSGKVRLEVRSQFDPETLGQFATMFGSDGAIIYPPASEREAQHFFPGDDFEVSTTENSSGGTNVTLIEVSFKDVNALLKSPYGKAHQLSLQTNGTELVLKAITGLEGCARMSNFEAPEEMGGFGEEEIEKAKKNRDSMKMLFRVTLPNVISGGNGNRDGRTAAWSADRKALGDEAFFKRTGEICETRCALDGIHFEPRNVPRLALGAFEEIAAGMAGGGGSQVDSNKVVNAAKFVPCVLNVTRTIDLSGDAGYSQNQASLIGAFLLPPELKPQKWGKPNLIEVVDEKGNDLLPGEDNDSSQMSFSEHGFDIPGDDGESAKESAKEAKHMVTFSFRPPDWTSREIARIRGSVDAQYFSGSQLVKLTNAIPAAWIISRTKASDMMSAAMDSGEKKIASAELAAAGIEMSMTMGMVQSGFTMLMLELESGAGGLLDAQVFDADGRPWPTFLPELQTGRAADSSISLMVAGKPRAPLSLVVLCAGNGTKVTLPIQVDHVPLNASKKN